MGLTLGWQFVWEKFAQSDARPTDRPNARPAKSIFAGLLFADPRPHAGFGGHVHYPLDRRNASFVSPVADYTTDKKLQYVQRVSTGHVCLYGAYVFSSYTCISSCDRLVVDQIAISEAWDARELLSYTTEMGLDGEN